MEVDMRPDNSLSMPLQGCAIMLRDFLSLLIRGRLASVSAINKSCQFTVQISFSISCKMDRKRITLSKLVNIVRHALYCTCILLSFTLSITTQNNHYPCFETDKKDRVRPRVNQTVALCNLKLNHLILRFPDFG